jgi:hypothetical protein
MVLHQVLEAVMGSLLNFELDDEQQLLLYLQSLLHILNSLTLLLVHIDLLLVVQKISPSLGRLLGTVVCSSTEFSDHTGKNEKVVIPMHQEA